jgi:hypothetical protein
VIPIQLPDAQPAQSRFPLGRVQATSDAMAAMTKAGVTPQSLLERHQCGDWGWPDAEAEERCINELAADKGMCVLSAYSLPDAERVMVATAPDRSTTIMRLESDYRKRLRSNA